MSSPKQLSLDKLRPPSLDTRALVKHAESSYVIIDRWNESKTKNQDVQDIVHQVQDLGVVFFSTIILSVKVAQQGVGISRDAITILRAILDGKPVQEIQAFIVSSRKKAQKLHKKTKHVSTRFQDVTFGLDKIVAQVPGIDAKLEAREQDALDKNAVAERRVAVVQKMQKALFPLAGAAGAVAAVFFPPATILLPIIVPIAVLASEIYQYKKKKRIKEREMEAKDCRDAVKELGSVSASLSKLKKGLDIFSDFWFQLDSSLDEVSARVRSLQRKQNRLELETILSIWQELHQEYGKYLSKLKRLQKMYSLSQKAKRRAEKEQVAVDPPKPAVLKKPKPVIPDTQEETGPVKPQRLKESIKKSREPPKAKRRKKSQPEKTVRFEPNS